MNPQQLLLTRLVGKKELSFGCLISIEGFGESIFVFIREEGGIVEYLDGESIEKTIQKVNTINHPATLSDLHRWMNEKKIDFSHTNEYIFSEKIMIFEKIVWKNNYPYDSSKDLLDQSPETLQQIINIITSNQ